MKRIIIIFWLMITCSLGFGQQVADFLMKAKALSERGNPSDAVKVINEALAVGKESSLYVERANANIIIGDYSKAISDLNEANNLTPFSGEYGLARIYALKGDAATSLYHLEMNLKSALRKKEKVILLDPAFGPIENSPQWRQFWKKEWFSDFEKSISEIEYDLSSGKIDESKEIIASLKRSYGSNDEILFAEASARHGIR